MTELLSSSAAIDHLISGTHRLIDVRSEGEFTKASIPGSQNSPILNNEERHAVGLCYKVAGQHEAIALGHKLVDPLRESRVATWIEIGASHQDSPIMIVCWRGGMRSQFATEWINSAGRPALRIEGGYKALRADLTSEFLKSRSFLVLSGRTGSGKTTLLKNLPIAEKIDIEELAAHRGSSFGRMMGRAQPSQATFENALSLGLRPHTRPMVVEDESKVIGSLHLPEALYASMSSSPVVQLEVSAFQRSQTIFVDYVEVPSRSTDAQTLESQLSGSVIFHQSIRPLGMKEEIPPFRLVFFDPKTASYQTLTTEPIPLQMEPSAAAPPG
ncbi:MAG: tRNA 2-selenouridine(34) synthase MnmH, partial [Proteobacteria bacterium]